MRLFSDACSAVADPYLARALSLAALGSGRTAPNPAVGCVVVRDGEVVGEGFHPQAGQPHAEVFALRAAGSAARGSTAYVSLEPCAHHGKTPPCTQALIDAGVSSVVIGMRDPNPAAAGGVDTLRSAGIAVRIAEDDAPFRALNAGWLRRLESGRPRVTVKLGLSLDAKIARVTGERASITGPSGRAVTARLRDTHDAVLVGAATVAADDPALTVRDASGGRADHQPTRFVLVGSAVPPASSRVFTDGTTGTVVLAPVSAAGDLDVQLQGLPAAVEVVRYDASAGIEGALDAVGAYGVNDLLVEPGARLFRALLEADAIDALVTVVAGGMGGMRAAGLEVAGMWDTHHDPPSLDTIFAPVETAIAGDVVVTHWERSLCESEKQATTQPKKET